MLGLLKEGLNNSQFRFSIAENTGNLTDCRLKLRINQTFLNVYSSLLVISQLKGSD